MSSKLQGIIFKSTIIGLIIFSFVAILFSSINWYEIILINVVILAILCISMYYSIVAYCGNIYYMTGNQEKARKYLKKAIDKNTKLSSAYLHYAVMLVKEDNGKDAIMYLDKTDSLKCDVITHKNIILTKASSYWNIGEIQKAIDLLEDMQKKYSYVNAHVLTTLGYMYILQKNYDKALECTTRAIEDNPESAAAWDNLGQIYYGKEEYEKAKESFDKALLYNNNLVDSFFYMGKIYVLEGDIDRAKEYLTKASKCDISALNTVTLTDIEHELQQLESFKS